MLSDFFGFAEEPFGATPDPRHLFESETHREALASLRYAYLCNRGFTALIARPGMGKTTLLLQFLQDIRNTSRSVFLFETQCDGTGLLRQIVRDLGLTPADHRDKMHEQLKTVLLEEAQAGKRLVVVVDEAQNLPDEALEMLRLLTNFETPQGKLMQIVLAGQPSLGEKLMQPSLEQFRQRVSTISFLEPFSANVTGAYIQHRLERAGYRGAPLFNADALSRIAAASQGIPRIINNLCFNTLSVCCALRCKQADGKMVAEAISDQALVRPARETVPLETEIALLPRHQQTGDASTFTRISLSAAAVMICIAGIGIVSHFTPSPFRNGPPGAQTARALSATAATAQLIEPPDPDQHASKDSIARQGPVQVTVETNQTLRGIVVRHLGSWNSRSLRQIEKLNPQLTNIDHIEAEQKIWLPAPDSKLPQPNLSAQAHGGMQP